MILSVGPGRGGIVPAGQHRLPPAPNCSMSITASRGAGTGLLLAAGLSSVRGIVVRGFVAVPVRCERTTLNKASYYSVLQNTIPAVVDGVVRTRWGLKVPPRRRPSNLLTWRSVKRDFLFTGWGSLGGEVPLAIGWRGASVSATSTSRSGISVGSYSRSWTVPSVGKGARSRWLALANDAGILDREAPEGGCAACRRDAR